MLLLYLSPRICKLRYSQKHLQDLDAKFLPNRVEFFWEMKEDHKRKTIYDLLIQQILRKNKICCRNITSSFYPRFYFYQG